ncbi:MAG: TonB family protein [Burkholderiaceae bacterium]
MPVLSVPPGLHAPRNDYLRIALVLSLAIHGAALTLRFVAPPVPPPKPSALEVTLVNARSEAAPIQPRMLAQNDLNGGGEAATGQAASPLPRTATESADEVVLAALRKRQEELETEQQRLLTQLLSEQQARPERKQPDLFEQSQDPGADSRHQESLILNARISALKERIERYNAQPRRQFTGPSTKSVDYAEYVEAWRKKIELLGTEHYPDQARGKVYGSLQLTVYIRRDGSLERIEIDRPSSHAVLNLAASRIVQLAAPFPPLPAAIAARTDVLAITRTWNFVNQTLETATP